MNFLFDTNAIIIYFRDYEIKSKLDELHNPLGDEHTAIISVVTLGEMESLALRNKWGAKRIRVVNDFLAKFVVADINAKSVISRYAEIEAFSQGKLEGKTSGVSARKMGKNDLWIAATASITGSMLITSDADFGHLKGQFLDMLFIDLKHKVFI